MIVGVRRLLRRIRNRLSRTTWAIRHFKLLPKEPAGNAPGLVLIQIDGLSEEQLQRGLDCGRLPFLKSLIAKEAYRKHVLYCGVPSCTPAVQAELFYGVKQAIPEFCYFDSIGGRIFSMFEGDDARELQSRLEARGEPLLKGGSAYADIFTGGADEAHFCMTQLGWPEIFRKAPPAKFALLMLLHVPSLLRIALLTVVEIALALADSMRGLIRKQDIWLELKFVPSRVAVCVLMREIIVMRAAMDFARELPVVHLNFLGYDEQSHRRGPASKFACWTLKGIDRAIKRVVSATHRSPSRDYDIWIYSDHGQIRTLPYAALAGETVQEAVSRVFDQTLALAHPYPAGLQLQRARMLCPRRHRPETQPPDRLPIVTALGPLGCIYLQTPTSMDERDAMARALVCRARIPMVFAADGSGRATVWTEAGRFALPEQAASVLGSDHRFLREVTADMIALTHHPQAGDFYIGGFRPGGPCVTFPNENGSHGGISDAETGAFALLPGDAPLPAGRPGVLRVRDLRAAALTFLHATKPAAPEISSDGASLSPMAARTCL